MKRLLLALVLSTASLGCMAQDQTPSGNISSQATIASSSEPGERLKLTVFVYDGEGKPLANQTLFAYHTDATGVYSKPVDDSRNPRLKGWVKTDKDGKFVLDTIKPGSYPGGGNPAHVHVYFFDGESRKEADECWFEGDRYLTDDLKRREGGRGKFTRIVKLAKGADGAWRGQWHLQRR